MNKQKNSRGFTLIELLVVIAIIAILAAILFPVFARARENARRASCQSNEKQMALGIMMYVQDYDEKFPMHWGYNQGGVVYSWPVTTQPYTKSKQLYFCPSDTFHNSANAISTANVSYGYNYNWLTMKSLATVNYPSETLLLGDTGLHDPAVIAAYVIYPTLSMTNYSPTNSHLEGCNFAFVDGHVKWLKAEKVVNDYSTPSLSLWGNRP